MFFALPLKKSKQGLLVILKSLTTTVEVKGIVENYYNRETVEQKAMFTLYKVRVKLMFTLYIAKCEHEFYSTLYKMCT